MADQIDTDCSPASEPSLQSKLEASPALDRKDRIRQETLAAAMAVLGFVVSLVLISQSTGFYHDDDICHYNLAVEGWTNPVKAWHSWGRPGYTLPVMPVAHLWGMTGCRVFSALQMMIVAYLAFRIARLIAPPISSSTKAGRMIAAIAPALAPLFVWLTPLAMQLSMTTLTEIPAALYLTLAVWLYLRGNPYWSSLILSLLFVTRYETLALAPIFLSGSMLSPLLADHAVVDRKDTWSAKVWMIIPPAAEWSRSLRRTLLMGLLMLWAPVVYLVVAWALALPEVASPFAMFHRHYGSLYGSGTWTHYLSGFVLDFAGAGIASLALAGIVSVGRRGRLVTLLAAGLLVLHTIIYMRGMFESGGYMRFLVPMSALVGALAALGLCGMLQWRRRLPTVAAGVVLMAFLYWLVKIHPGTLPPALLLERINWAGALLGIPVMMAAFAQKESMRKLACGVVLAGAIAALVAHAAVVRPLAFSRDNSHLLAVEAVQALPTQYVDRPGLARHVFVPYIRPATTLMSDNREALEQWLSSQRGTLFFWDNRYCDADLQASMNEHGQLLWAKTLVESHLEVYERR